MGQGTNDSDNDYLESDLVRQDPSFEDLVVEFVKGLESRIRAMDEAIKANDLESLRRAAHQLKGSGGGYGYPAITERAASLEHFARTQSVAECRMALEELRRLCKRVVVRAD